MKQNNYFDYCVYTIIALSFFLRLISFGAHDLIVEEAYYWNYACHLDFGYLDHPPMVAVLIKFFTLLFGVDEFGIRVTALFCWCIAAFFSFKLTNLIAPQAGKYSIMLLAILPFFFIESLVITPDQPLTACWSAALYYLYKALVLHNKSSWYKASISLGLGMLSKYTIVLLAPSIFLYLCLIPSARHWLRQKEPYCALLLVILLFTPVIYWNATHDWASFLFQTSRRFNEKTAFYFPQFLALFFLFMTPVGVWELSKLFKKNEPEFSLLQKEARYFLQIFTLVPLLIFGLYSFSHVLKFNWIGTGLLAVIPWLALRLDNTPAHRMLSKAWQATAITLLICYGVLIVGVIFGKPQLLQQKILKKYISWHNLTEQFYAIAKEVEARGKTTPIFVPLDLYNINSELSFYQAKFLAHHQIKKTYPILGQHLFGGQSLMYYYWSPREKEDLHGKTLIFISTEPQAFQRLQRQEQMLEKSSLFAVWSYSQKQHAQIKPYYYQIVKMNEE